MLRQQWEREGQTTFRSLADYIAPVESGVADYLGAFAVTAGLRRRRAGRRSSRRDHDDYNAIMAKALADRLAEAFAELLHERARRDWGYGRDEQLSQGRPDRGEVPRHPPRRRLSRPAPTTPRRRRSGSCSTSRTATGIRLTESYAMYPAASVSGLYFAHPEARYFAVDLITRDQVENYARRKGMPLAEVERWLAPNLAYEPG